MTTKDIEDQAYYVHKTSGRIGQLVDRVNDLIYIKYVGLNPVPFSVSEFLSTFKKKTVEYISPKSALKERMKEVQCRHHYKNTISGNECEVVMVGEETVYIKYPHQLTPIAVREGDFFKNFVLTDKPIPLTDELKPGSSVIQFVPIEVKSVEGVGTTSHQFEGPSEWAPLFKEAL